MTEAKINNKIFTLYTKAKQSNLIKQINNILYSPWGIIIMSLLTLITHLLKIELALYSFVIIYVSYACLFCEDFLPLVCLFIFCYISPSFSNNPGANADSIFFGGSGIAIIIIGIICAGIIFTRIGLDKTMGFKKLFTMKRKLWLGLVILGASYLLSGIGSKGYLQTFWSNILFATLQFLSIFLLYFIFSATIKWEKVNFDYFAYLFTIAGLTVFVELINVYLTQNILQNGEIFRGNIATGWGMHNNIGALLTMTLPFVFYLACKKKHTYIYLAIATIISIGIIFSCSRNSILVGAVIYLTCVVINFVISDNKKWFRISCGILVALTIIIALIFLDKLLELFAAVPKIFESTGDGIKFYDNDRFRAYGNGLQVFINNPIFGESFYQKYFISYDYSKIDAFSKFFPPRWHSTIIQLLASCGIIGMLAYLYHRCQTIVLFIKNPTTPKTFMGLSILALLIMSLIDCHMFNIGPVMIYSIILAFAEFLPKKQPISEPKQIDDNLTKTTVEQTKYLI